MSVDRDGTEFWTRQRLVISCQHGDDRPSWTMDKPFALIGSHPGSDVQLANCDPRVLLAFVTQKGIAVVLLAARAKKAGQVFLLREDQTIPIGDRSFSFQASGEGDGNAPASEMDSHADEANASISCVTWKTAHGRQFRQLKDQCPLVIGRKTPSGLTIPVPGMSGVHCCLFRSGDRFWAWDLQSTNGTWYGEKKIEHSEIVADQPVVLGKTRIRIAKLFLPEAKLTWNAELTHANERLSHAKRLQQTLVDDAEEQQGALLASLQSVHRQMELQRQEYERVVAQKDAHLAAQRDQLDTLDVEHQQLRRQLDAFNESESSLVETRRILRDELDQIRAQVDNLQLEKQQLDERLASRERELSEREQELTTLTAELQSQRQETEQLQSELTTERGILKNLECHLGGAPAAFEAPPALEDEHLVASPDFHAILDDALSNLPRIDE